MRGDENNRWLFAAMGVVVQMHQSRAWQEGRSTWAIKSEVLGREREDRGPPPQAGNHAGMRARCGETMVLIGVSASNIDLVLYSCGCAHLRCKTEYRDPSSDKHLSLLVPVAARHLQSVVRSDICSFIMLF